MITGREGSGDVFITTLELYYNQVETASNTQGKRFIDNFVFMATYRSAAELEIRNVPPGVTAYPGSSKLINITVANTGGILINNVTLRLNTTLDPAWINITPYNYTLDVNEVGIFTVNITPPSGATPEYVLSYLEADSNEGATDIEPLPTYISDLIVETDMDYYNNRNQSVNITVNVTNLSLIPTTGAMVNLTITAPDGINYYLSATENMAGTYNVLFNDTGQKGQYLVESNATSGSSLGYNFTYFYVDFLLVNFSFYSDSGYTLGSRDFDINDTIYFQADVTYSNYTNLSGALSSINITSPNGTAFVIPVIESTPGIYRGNFSQTRTGGNYQFYARATDSRNIIGSDTDTLTLPVYTTFPPGTLVIPMDSQQVADDQISAYGLVHWLLANNTPVDWVILHDKNFDGVDFNATNDDDASNATGTIQDRNYSSGPLLIRDPNPATSWNEAWNTIQQITADKGYTVVIHELNQTLNIETRDDYVLDRPARIAIQDTDENLIRYLWDAVTPSAAMNVRLCKN